MRASGRWFMRVGRFSALLIALVVPACNNSGAGGSGQPGIVWNTQSGSGGQVGGPQPAQLLWVDPNSGLGGGQIGITGIIQSTDPATYGRYNVSTRPPPFNQFISYIFALEHPLATDTTASAITQRESTLQGLINGYRGMSTPIVALALPNASGGGGIGGGVIGGGMGGTTGGAPIPGHQKGTQCARAHCKHYAYFHPGFPGRIPGGYTGGAPGGYFMAAQPNFEGDFLLDVVPGSAADTVGVPAPGNPDAAVYGRLGKIGVRANKQGWCEYAIAGASFPEPLDAYAEMLLFDPDILAFVNWTNMAVGHWRGGVMAYYWNIIFIIFPNPPG
jgi:hypothetical protein